MMTSLIVIVQMSSSDYGPDSNKNKEELKVPVKITNEYAVVYCLETINYWFRNANIFLTFTLKCKRFLDVDLNF